MVAGLRRWGRVTGSYLPPIFRGTTSEGNPTSSHPPSALSKNLLRPTLFFQQTIIENASHAKQTVTFPSNERSSQRIHSLPTSLQERAFLPTFKDEPNYRHPDRTSRPRPKRNHRQKRRSRRTANASHTKRPQPCPM